jgi:ABC-type protease/lipase transport system fused ATPase/permease subunit
MSFVVSLLLLLNQLSVFEVVETKISSDSHDSLIGLSLGFGTAFSKNPKFESCSPLS